MSLKVVVAREGLVILRFTSLALASFLFGIFFEAQLDTTAVIVLIFWFPLGCLCAYLFRLINLFRIWAHKTLNEEQRDITSPTCTQAMDAAELELKPGRNK